jgi:malate dehydrogenase (oxaloacetate-decarboxylating)
MPDLTSVKNEPNSIELHRRYRGKVQMTLKCPVRDDRDFAVWYTPGVAAPCRAIEADPNESYELTNRANSIAILSDGTRVLGLGNIGPTAGLPVMEGKALLFKILGGVDAIPLCVRVRSEDELIRVAEAIAPTFGGINLEDIAQPKCFRVLHTLRARMDIPVWHDDQQGTAVAAVAGLINALRVVGKSHDEVRIAMVGMGAANVATYRLLTQVGVSPGQIVGCDRKGILHSGRTDLEAAQQEFTDKWRVCSESNADRVTGGIAEALRGADACLAFSQPGPQTIRSEWVRAMARQAIVFACANPVPEIWPTAAREAGAAVVATGRSDFPNQVNNSLVFPGMFRGVLDVRATKITDRMMLAAMHELAAAAEPGGLSADRILPPMSDRELPIRLAVATGLEAQHEGVAMRQLTGEAIRAQAARIIERTRATLDLLRRERLIAPIAD